MSWRVELYETADGKRPVEDFLRTLQPVTFAKVRNQINLLAEFGISLGMPNAKPIGGGLFELRIRGKEEVRCLYIYQKDNIIVILHVFKKKTMVIPRRELKAALQRKKDVDRYN